MIARRAFLGSAAAFAAAPLFAPRKVWAAGSRLRFSGAKEQGGLVIGHAQPGARVSVDGAAVNVSPEGLFAFGFAYNATKPARITATFADGTKQRADVSPVTREYEIQRINGLPSKYVSPPEDVLARIRREHRQIHEARTRDSDGIGFSEKLDWPAPGIISSVYGSQRILNGVPKSPHLGVDIAAPEGTPIKAPAPGVISLAEPDFYYDGGITIIDHGHGVSTCYIHQSKLLVKAGDKVPRGAVIGHIGQTGRATGPNVHWQLNLFQERLDPSLSTTTPKPLTL